MEEKREHFKGIVPDERWKNELLDEVREIRKMLQKLTGQEPAKEVMQQEEMRTKRPYKRKGA